MERDKRMKMSDVPQAIEACLSNQITPCLIGASGIGKSEVVKDTMLALGYLVVDARLSYKDPVDLHGLPTIAMVDGREVVKWAAPIEFLAVDQPKCFFWDEITHAPSSVQSMAYEILTENRVAGHPLPDDCFHVAAHNRIADKGIHNRVPNPLRRRWVEVEVETDVASWSTWAFGHGIDAVTIACLRNNPDMLYRDMDHEQKAPDPRAWVKVDRLTSNNSLPQEVWYELVKGMVGEGDAVQYKAYLELYKHLPSIDEIRLNPKTAKVPGKSDTGLLHAVSCAVARYMTAGTVDQFYQYLRRLPPEYAVFTMRDALVATPAIKNTKGFVQFCTEYQYIV